MARSGGLEQSLRLVTSLRAAVNETEPFGPVGAEISQSQKLFWMMRLKRIFSVMVLGTVVLSRSFTGLPFTRNVIAPMRAQSILTGNRSTQSFLGDLPAGAVATADAFISDQFQYTGSQAMTMSLTWNMEGIVDDPVGIGSEVANGLTQIRAAAAIFEDTPQYRFLDDVPTLVAELGATLKQSNGVDAVDLFQTLLIEDDTNGQIAQRSLTLNFDVNPGETFYIWQNLRTSAAFGTRQADAFGTMTGEFSHPELVSRIGIVPEPGSLMVLSMLGLGIVTRRKRSCA